jgi:dsRNA-specific ribonuclease
MEEEVLQQIEQIIGYRFSNRNLLAEAFMHASAVDNRAKSNERMEFLGDSVLALVICRAIFDEMLDEKGPDHNKCFEVQAAINERRFPSAWGTNKKEAEQKAALNALVELGVIKDYCEDTERS